MAESIKELFELGQLQCLDCCLIITGVVISVLEAPLVCEINVLSILKIIALPFGFSCYQGEPSICRFHILTFLISKHSGASLRNSSVAQSLLRLYVCFNGEMDKDSGRWSLVGLQGSYILNKYSSYN